MKNLTQPNNKFSISLSEGIVDTLREPILVLDKKLRVITANLAFYNKFQVSKEKTIGGLIYDLGNGQWNIPNLQKLLEEIIPQRKEITDYRITHNFLSIGIRTMLINAREIMNQEDSYELIFLSIEDITDRLNNENKLQDITDQLFVEKEKAVSTLLSIGDGFISTDIYGRISEINKISEVLTGYSRGEAIGKLFEEVFHIYDETTREQRENPIQKVIKTGFPTSIEINTILIAKNGEEYFIEDSASPIVSKDGQLIGAVLIFRDVTKLKKQIRENDYLSNHDFGTGLFNRHWFTKKFSEYDACQYFPIGVMMIDINGLKIINDAFGHAVGDLALRKIGDILSDTFKSKGIVSRIGGDEFAVILPRSSQEKLQYYKDTLKEAVKKQKINNIELSLAIGYELKNDSSEDIDDILKLAENHMYRHKSVIGSSSRNHAINAILETLTDKYSIEKKHSIEVSHLCRLVGKHLELREDELKELEQAGMFHDIGKISIPDAILNKPGKLTDEEYDIIKTHTEVGYQILRAADEYSDLAIHALHHHERWDGKGYPSKLKKNDIPLFSRIICIVDAYEAMTADRPYRKAMQVEDAVKELYSCSGTQFDPNLVEIFIKKVLPKEFPNYKYLKED